VGTTNLTLHRRTLSADPAGATWRISDTGLFLTRHHVGTWGVSADTGAHSAWLAAHRQLGREAFPTRTAALRAVQAALSVDPVQPLAVAEVRKVDAGVWRTSCGNWEIRGLAGLRVACPRTERARHVLTETGFKALRRYPDGTTLRYVAWDLARLEAMARL